MKDLLGASAGGMSSHLTRRTVLASGVAAATSSHAATAAPVRLQRLGAERQLPDRLLGLNTPANNAIPLEDPAFAPAVREMGPAYFRFPGGTVSNYYDWRTGQLDVPRGPPDAVVRNLFADVAENSRRNLHPNGVRWDDFHAFAERCGADVVVLPNIETSTPENEAARFFEMARKGTSPRHIELGNEFTHALLMDPQTLKVFPDFRTSMARMKAFLQAIRPHLRKDALVAAQSASARFQHPASLPPQDARARREQDWDDQLRPEPWFDAVTVHLYPTLSAAAGLDAARDLPANLGRIYPAMLARADEGFERTLADTAARVPGKEIWLTEWGGYDRNATFGSLRLEFNGLWLHQIIRGMLAQLRHRQVTVSNYHALFVRGDLGSVFRRDGSGGYAPVNAAGVLSWFFHAARGPGAHYQGLTSAGSTRILAHGTIPGEGFRDVDAALFRRRRERTLFVHNAWSTARQVEFAALAPNGAAITAEVVDTPELLASLQQAAPTPRQLPVVGRSATLPPYSLARVTWTA